MTEASIRDARILRESIQEFPGPVAVYDEQDRLIACNDLYRWVHGDAFANVVARNGGHPLHYADLVRESVRGVVSPEKLEAHIEDRLRAQREANGEPIDRYYPGRGWFRIVKLRTPSGAIAGFATDITELKETTIALEQARIAAEAANIAKSAFLANMSHELKTPLNAIIGLADALQTGVLGQIGNDRDRQYMADIHRAGSHLLALINDILDLAKIEAGALELNRRVFPLGDLLRDSVSMVQPIADAVQIRLDSDFPADMPQINGDSLKIRQVILNILSNAIKYSPPGSSVRIAATVTRDGVQITVEDHGVGIARDKLALVFEPFGRLNHGISAPTEGAGLGLSIARRLLDLHGGKIRIESEPGQGTCVRINLPPDMIV